MPATDSQTFLHAQVHTASMLPGWLSNFPLKVFLKNFGAYSPPSCPRKGTLAPLTFMHPRTVPCGAAAGKAGSTRGHPLCIPLCSELWPAQRSPPAHPNHPQRLPRQCSLPSFLLKRGQVPLLGLGPLPRKRSQTRPGTGRPRRGFSSSLAGLSRLEVQEAATSGAGTGDGSESESPLGASGPSSIKRPRGGGKTVPSE